MEWETEELLFWDNLDDDGSQSHTDVRTDLDQSLFIKLTPWARLSNGSF